MTEILEFLRDFQKIPNLVQEIRSCRTPLSISTRHFTACMHMLFFRQKAVVRQSV